MNKFAVGTELGMVAAIVLDAQEWLRKGDLQQAICAVEEAGGRLANIEHVIGDAIIDEECGPESVPSPSVPDDKSNG